MKNVFVYVKELGETQTHATAVPSVPNLSASVVSQQVSDRQCKVPLPVHDSRLFHLSCYCLSRRKEVCNVCTLSVYLFIICLFVCL